MEYIPTTGLAISIGLADRLYGFDRHVWDMDIKLAVQSREITLAISLSYIVSTSLTKLSILCFYRRMAVNTIERWFLYTVWASMAFVLAYMLTFVLTIFLGCKPLPAYWNQVDPSWAQTNGWKCFNEGAVMLAASAISVVQDFLACGLPLLLFRKLQIPRRQKVALGCIFSVGIFLCVTGILRMVYIFPLYNSTYDIPWHASPVWTWTAVEAHMAIVCASAPALKLFFRKVLAVSGYSGHSSPPAYGRSSQRHQKGLGRRGGAAGNTSFACVGEGGGATASMAMQREYELESWRGAMGYREEGLLAPAVGAGAGGGGLQRMGSLRGINSAKVERGSWFGDPEDVARASEEDVAGGGGPDLERGIKVARRVDVTVTEARDEGEFSGLEDEAKDAGSSARTSSETKLVRGDWNWL
ncbi:hypothetical protein SLS57_010100 [Botryosphaeria dothidea]